MKKIFIFLTIFSIFINANINEIFSLKTINGKKLTVKGTDSGMIVTPYEGKIIFIVFWKKWCDLCISSFPYYEKLQEKYSNKLKVIAIETTPEVSDKELIDFVHNPVKSIKNTNEEVIQKDTINSLIKFLEAGKNITFDIVSNNEAKYFINYIRKRARWQGDVPFLIVLKPNGNVLDIIQGKPTQNRIDAIINIGFNKIKHKLK